MPCGAPGVFRPGAGICHPQERRAEGCRIERRRQDDAAIALGEFIFSRFDPVADQALALLEGLGPDGTLGLMNGMSVLEAVRRYSILTVGDGLISQIPALIVATTSERRRQPSMRLRIPSRKAGVRW